MTDRLTRKQVAESWGVTRQYIGQLVKKGVLREDANHTIDPAEAARVRASFNPENMAKEAEAKELGGQRSAEQNQGSAIVQARTADALFKAKQRELIVKKMSGELVPTKRVKADAFEVGRIAGQALRVLPQRLASHLAGKLAGLSPREAEVAAKAILENEVKRVIADIIGGLEKVANGEAKAA